MENSPTPNAVAAKLPIIEKIGYASGDFASCLYFGIFMNFLAFYYTDVFGISAAAVGTMIFVTRTWDWINDPIMGAITDRTKSKLGKFRPWILWMILPYMVIGILTFTAFDLSDKGKVVYAFITYTALTMVYTMINIPYSALMGVMTAKSEERTVLASYRFIGAYAGTAFVTGTLMYFVGLFGQGNVKLGYTLTVVLYALLAGVLFYFTFAVCKERVAPPKSQKTNLREDLKALIHNTPWVVMVILSVVTIIANAIRLSSTMHYFKYVAGDEMWGGQLLFINGIASTFIVFFTKQLTAFFRGKKNAFMMMNFISAILLCLFFFIPIHVFWINALFQVILAFTLSPLMPLFWSMIADTADYGAVKLNQRSTGLLFSAGTFSQKIGWSIGPAIAMWILGWVGFEANVAQSDASLLTMRLLMSFVPAAVAVLAGLIVIFYKIDTKMEKELEAALAAESAEKASS